MIAFLLLCSVASAAVGVKDEGTMIGAATDIDFVGNNIAATTDGSKVTVTIADKTRTIELPILTFAAVSDGMAVLSTSTVPGLEIDGSMLGLVWADNEVTPVQVTFAVPDDYISGGSFRLFADESDSTTPNQVDFAILTNSDGAVVDSSSTDQTPVALTGTAGTPCEVTLTVATDFASLAAGNRVTLKLWRDNVAAGTGDLEVSNVVFDYEGD